jgi:hypothetical protein
MDGGECLYEQHTHGLLSQWEPGSWVDWSPVTSRRRRHSRKTTAPITKEVRAQSFTLVDSSDHALGVFTTESASRAVNSYMGEPTPVRIVLRDSKGREIWSAGGSGIRPVTER